MNIEIAVAIGIFSIIVLTTGSYHLAKYLEFRFNITFVYWFILYVLLASAGVFFQGGNFYFGIGFTSFMCFEILAICFYFFDFVGYFDRKSLKQVVITIVLGIGCGLYFWRFYWIT